MTLIDTPSLLKLRAEGNLVIDCRSPHEYVAGFIPDSIYLPAHEHPIDWLTPIIEGCSGLICIGNIPAVLLPIAKVALIDIHGYVPDLSGWIAAQQPIDMIIDIDADEFALDYQFDEFYLVDVREAILYQQAHCDHAENIPMIELEDILPDLQSDQLFYLYGSDYAQVVAAAALFRRYGLDKLRIVNVGFEDIRSQNIPIITPPRSPKSPEPSKN